MIKLVQSTQILIDLFTFFMLCNDQIDKRAYTGKPIITLPAIYLFVSFSFTFSSLHYYDHYIVSTRLCVRWLPSLVKMPDKV